MALPTFHRLYDNAMRKERLVILQIAMLWAAGLASTFPRAACAAATLLAMHDTFIDKLEAVALRNRMPIQSPLHATLCPHCGAHDCIAEGASLALPPAIVTVLQQLCSRPPAATEPPPGLG